jgi:hypothetical protein
MAVKKFTIIVMDFIVISFATINIIIIIKFITVIIIIIMLVMRKVIRPTEFRIIIVFTSFDYC